jgi:hypothetical protein
LVLAGVCAKMHAGKTNKMNLKIFFIISLLYKFNQNASVSKPKMVSIALFTNMLSL